QDDFGSRQPDQSNGLGQRFAVMPSLKRPEHVLSGRVGTVEKPDVKHAVAGEGFPAFYLANSAQRSSLFVAHFVAAPVAAGSEDHRHALVFIEDGFGEIA